MPATLYLKRSEIDDVKWDACIDNASNGLIYGYAFYLDAFCTAWDAVVLDDYSAVMPLPWRKKWGIYYLYQPFAVAQLGLFGNDLSAEILHGFLKNIPLKFQYWDFPLNFRNLFFTLPVPLYERKNFVLPLQQPYETIQANYRQQLKRNLKKAITNNCVAKKYVDIDIVIALAKKHHPTNGTITDFMNFKTVFQFLKDKEAAITYGVKSATGAVLATAVFFIWRRRAYYILPGNHPHGRTSGASHLLIDSFIKDHTGKNLLLDFEGSDVPGLQFFYGSFGAAEENYAAIRNNRLPWLIRWMK